MPKAAINGTEIFYTSIGTGQPYLVMHGGMGLDHTYLHPALDSLGDIVELIYYDHRGNGRSGRLDTEAMRHMDFAADADALAAHLGHEKVGVIGHSYGGFIALEFAIRHPERVSHMILLNTAPAAVATYGEEVNANITRKGASSEIRAALTKRSTTADEFRDWWYSILPLYFKRYDPEIAQGSLSNCIFSVEGMPTDAGAYDVRSRLGEIDVPTLVLTGRDDFITPPSQSDIIYKSIRQAELTILEESGHFPWLEEPNLFFSAIRDWIKRVS